MESYCPLEFRDPRPLTPDQMDRPASWHLSGNQVRQLLVIMHSMNQGLELDQVLDELYLSVRQIIPCNRLGLALTDVERKFAVSRWVRSDRHILLSSGYQAPLAGSSLAEISRTGKVRIINDLNAYSRDHPESYSTRLLVQEGMRSSLTCPLTARREPIGFLFFTSAIPHAYNDAQVSFYQQIASQIAMVIEKARLYSELNQYAQTIARQNQAIRRDLELAAQLQRTFIPDKPPQVPGLDVSLLYEPLAEVGGDLVELVPLDDQRLVVLVADAMGHGVSAALAMAMVKATFSAILREGTVEPAAILQRLNQVLPPLLKNHFASALAMLIDPRTNRLCSARAALPPPVIVDAAIGARTIDEGGPPLSVDDSEPYVAVETAFNPGDTLIVATDGLIEANNDVGEDYGMGRLVAAASACRGRPSSQCLQALMADLSGFRNTKAPSDDLSVVVIRRIPSEPAKPSQQR